MSNKSRRTPSKPIVAASGRSFAVLLIVGPIVGLALGLWLLGSVWPVDNDPTTALIYGGACGLFSGLLGAGAVAGSLAMSKRAAWLSPLVGLLFAVGFTGLVLAGLGSTTAPWRLIGVIGIALCVIWFYALGMISGYIPPLYVKRYGTWTAPAVGIVLIIVSVANGSLEGLVVGALTVAAWAGILVGSLRMRAQTMKS